MITLKSCPVCNSLGLTQYPKIGSEPHVNYEMMPGVKLNAAIITTYSICNNCHVIFQNPRMTNSDLKRYYSEGYYRKMINMTKDEMDKDEAWRAAMDSKIIKGLLKNIESHLDVGCGRGYLLTQVGAKKKYGVEANKKYVTEKDILVFSDIAEINKQQFGLVTAIHVLEHEPKPAKLLKEMVALTTSDGYLIIEVPTWNSQGGPLRLPHLFHFEPDVLRLMCKQAGLQVVDVEFTPHLILICKKESR